MDNFKEFVARNSRNSIYSNNIAYFLKEFVDRILADKISQDTACSCLDDIYSETLFLQQKYSEQPPDGSSAINSSFINALELLSQSCEMLKIKLNNPPPYLPSYLEEAREMIVIADELMVYISNAVNKREAELRKDIDGE